MGLTKIGSVYLNKWCASLNAEDSCQQLSISRRLEIEVYPCPLESESNSFRRRFSHETSHRSKRQRRTNGERGRESTSMASQAAPSIPSAANEEAGSVSQFRSLIDSPNVLVTGGQFNQTAGHHANVHITVNREHLSFTTLLILRKYMLKAPGSSSGSPSSNGTDHINSGPPSGQSTQPNPERVSQRTEVFSQNQETPFQKSNDIYERHLIPKGRGFPLWIPEPNLRLPKGYRRTGIRIGDVGIITPSGAFSFLFNICLPHDDAVNDQMSPENFAPISPPIKPMDIDEYLVFQNDSHFASASITRSQTSADISDIVFESSASEGAILTMPQGARSEDLGNFARFREYAAANVADWYKFVNGVRGREAKNGDIRLVVGFDKTTFWGIATFASTIQNNCRLRFGPSRGAGSASTYRWEYSGVAQVRTGPGPNHNDGLRQDGDPPDIQFENQCLFVRTLNTTLSDPVWADIHSNLGSVHVDPRYNQSHHYSNSNRHSSNPSTDSDSSFLPSQGARYGTQRTAGSVHESQDVDGALGDKPEMFISGPLENLMAHPSKVLNDILLAEVCNAKMVITHDDDWCSVIKQYDTLPDPHDLITNILSSRNVCEENGVVFLKPKEIPNEPSESSASVNCLQADIAQPHVKECERSPIVCVKCHIPILDCPCERSVEGPLLPEHPLVDQGAASSSHVSDVHDNYGSDEDSETESESSSSTSSLAHSIDSFDSRSNSLFSNIPSLSSKSSRSSFMASSDFPLDPNSKSQAASASSNTLGSSLAGSSRKLSTIGLSGGTVSKKRRRASKMIRENQEKSESMGNTTDMNSKDSDTALGILIEEHEETDYSEEGEEGEEEAKEQQTRKAATIGATPHANASVPLISSPTAAGSPLSSPVEGTGESFGRSLTVLRGTIISLKRLQQTAGLTLVPGLKSLVGLVLNILEIVNNMHNAEDTLIELAQNACFFIVSLVEQTSDNTLSDSDSMKSIIEGLTKEMNRALGVVKKISSQRTTKRLLLSDFDKAVAKECNRQMALVYAISRIQIAVISQQAIARIEAQLDMVQMNSSIPPQSNQLATNAPASIYNISLSIPLPVTSRPTAKCLPPPPSPVGGSGGGEAYDGTCRVLDGTIIALKLVQQVVGRDAVPGLQSLVELVLKIAKFLNNMYIANDALIELAQKAGFFIVTLVELASIISLSDSDSTKSVIEGLTKEMNRVLGVVKRISSQRTVKRPLSASDRAAVDDCISQMVLACGVFGVQIAFISQQTMARTETKLDLALGIQMPDSIPPQPNQPGTMQRATSY